MNIVINILESYAPGDKVEIQWRPIKMSLSILLVNCGRVGSNKKPYMLQSKPAVSEVTKGKSQYHLGRR